MENTVFVRGARRLVALESTSIVPEPMTDWVPCIGVERLRFAWLCTAQTGQTRFRPAVQFASVRTDKPGDWQMEGTVYTSLTWRLFDKALSDYQTGGGDDEMYMRFGIACGTVSSSALGSCDAFLNMSYRSKGRMAGVLPPTQLRTYGTTEAFEPITGWVTTEGLSAVKAAFLVTGEAGNLEYALGYRTADTSYATTSAWAALSDDTVTAVTTNDERNTGPLSGWGSLTDKAWIQFGVAYSLTSGSSIGQATCSAAVGCIY